jgi:hypothetical protein
MTGTVHGAHQIKNWVSTGVHIISDTENITPMLLWVMIRQQADHELLLIKEQAETE